MENILQTLLGTTDTYFAGKLTDNAIAGISVTNIIMNIFISLLQRSALVQLLLSLETMVKQDYSKTNQMQWVQSILVAIQHSGLLVGVICLIFLQTNIICFGC
ncbi:MAG: hypothetical protein ACLTAI_12600 [Thomasclavelia sp.]